MFQFTTTNIINSNLDFTTGKSLWTSQAATDDECASLNIKRVNKFLADNVTAIYKAEAFDGELAKITIDFSEVDGTEGDQYRLALYIGLTQASQDSRFSNDLTHKGKPFSIDFVWGESAADTVKALVKIINKYELLVYGEKLLSVSYSGTYLTIEATTEYQRFIKVDIDKFDEDKYHGMGEYTTVRSLADIAESNTVDSNEEVTSSAEAYFAGKEGFGTYSFLLHNLRLPTYERTAWTAVNSDEAPIVGAKYNQYTIHYCVDRGVLGLNAVGDTVKSQTTHVFYVNTNVAEEFESALGVIGTIEDVSDSSSDSESSTTSTTTTTEE